MGWDAGNRPDGSCAKRIALRSPMQRAAMAHATCCDGCCTALRHSAEDTDVGQGVLMAFILNRPPALANHFPSVRPILFAPRLLSLGKTSEPFLLNCKKASSCGMGCSGEMGERVEEGPAWAWILWGRRAGRVSAWDSGLWTSGLRERQPGLKPCLPELNWMMSGLLLLS